MYQRNTETKVRASQVDANYLASSIVSTVDMYLVCWYK